MRAILRAFLLGIFLTLSLVADAALHDMVEMSVTGNPGTGSFALNAAVSPYIAFGTALTSGETVTYHAQDGSGNWENGRGVWTSGGGGGTLTRATILTSSNANAIVNFSATSPTVFITAAAEDILTGVYPNVELSLNSQPLCPLTDAATVLVAAGPACVSDATKGIAYDSLTLTANGHLLDCPTGATVSGSGILLRINEGAGPYKISPKGCYYFPSTGALDTLGNIALSGIANGINQFYCELQGISTGNGFPVQYECGAVQAGIGSATVYVVSTTVGAASGTNITSWTVGSVPVTAGDTLVILDISCGSSPTCASGSFVASTGISGTGISSCSEFTGAGGAGASLAIDAWHCSITASGTPTITQTWGGGGINDVSLIALDLHNAAPSPDAGVGNVASAASGTSFSVATNGNTQQSDGFILSFASVFGSTVIPSGNGTTISSTGTGFVQDKIVYAPGATYTATGSWTGSAGSIANIVEVLHN